MKLSEQYGKTDKIEANHISDSPKFKLKLMLKRLLPKPSLIRRAADGTLAIVEGYWRDEKHKDTGLPWPRQNLLLWPFFIRFQFKLKKVESVASITNYKGSSHCRICKCPNETHEYSLTHQDGTHLRWPGGLRHYYLLHFTVPSRPFHEHIMSYKLRF